MNEPLIVLKLIEKAGGDLQDSCIVDAATGRIIDGVRGYRIDAPADDLRTLTITLMHFEHEVVPDPQLPNPRVAHLEDALKSIDELLEIDPCNATTVRRIISDALGSQGRHPAPVESTMGSD